MSTSHKQIKEKAKEAIRRLKEHHNYDENLALKYSYEDCKRYLKENCSDCITSKRINNKVAGILYSKITQKTETIFQKYLNKLIKKRKKPGGYSVSAEI